MREDYLPHALNIICSIWGVVVFFFVFLAFLLFLAIRRLCFFLFCFFLFYCRLQGVSSAMKPPVHS